MYNYLIELFTVQRNKTGHIKEESEHYPWSEIWIWGINNQVCCSKDCKLKLLIEKKLKVFNTYQNIVNIVPIDFIQFFEHYIFDWINLK